MDQTVPAYAAEVADYGRSRDPEPGEGALVKNVRPESPAWDVGIEPGMRVLTVNGEQLTDRTGALSSMAPSLTACVPA